MHGLTSISSSGAYNSTVQRNVESDLDQRITSQYGPASNAGLHFGYDQLGRLAADSSVIVHPSGCYHDPDSGWTCGPQTSVNWVHTFQYDAVGNRLPGTYDAGNRVTSFGGCSYQYHWDGNIASRTCGTEVTGFGWYADRMYSISRGGRTYNLEYNAFGELVRMDVPVGSSVGTHIFLWDRGNLLAELDMGPTPPTLLAEYSYYPGLDQLHAIKKNGVWHYAHVDALGNVIALTDQNQAVKRTYIYDEWGNITGGSDVLGFANTGSATESCYSASGR